LSLWT